MRAGSLVVAVLVLALAGCGDESDSGEDAGASSPQTKRISKADFPKGSWPLKVADGVVRCEGSKGSGAVIFRTNDGDDYGVNGTALSQGLPGIEPIWKKDPDVPGARINISPVLDTGLKLCR